MNFLKSLKKRIIAQGGPWLAYWTIRALAWTMRFEEVHLDPVKSIWESEPPCIGAFWHGRLLMMPWAYLTKKGRKLSFLVSFHRDGQMVAKALKRFGFHPILGSTRRGGSAALKEMVQAIREGFDVAIVPDGPRGPRCHAELGAIELARRTGTPLVPVSFNASRRKIFETWDRFLLPYPFSRGVFVWGEPIYVDPRGDRDHLEEKRLLLEKRLNDVTEEADRYFAKDAEDRNP